MAKTFCFEVETINAVVGAEPQHAVHVIQHHPHNDITTRTVRIAGFVPVCFETSSSAVERIQTAAVGGEPEHPGAVLNGRQNGTMRYAGRVGIIMSIKRKLTCLW